MKTTQFIKKLFIAFVTVVTVLSAVLPNSSTVKAASGNLIIMLDPGHGGEDGGAENTVDGVYYNENKLMLKVANYAKSELSQYPGVKVLLTRESTDTYLTLAQRVSKATANGAHAIISLHANSYSGSSANGAEALVAYGKYRPDVATASQSIGSKILSQLASLGLKNRGLVERYDNQDEIIAYYPDGSLQDYYGIVQRAVRGGIPGVIIETAFISNQSDVRNHFSSDAKLQTLGKAIATGIAKHYGLSKSTTASAEQRPHIDARELTFVGNPDTSFLYPQKNTKVTQSDGYATLTKGHNGIKVYIDYMGMSFDAEDYPYAVIRMRSPTSGATATITTGAYEITYDDPAFTYKADLTNEFQNILIEMAGNEEWTFGVNFMKIQIAGADSADIESVKFYASKPSAENILTAVHPSPRPTQTQTAKPTQKPTEKPAESTSANYTESPAAVVTPTAVSSDMPTQTPATQTENPAPTPTVSPAAAQNNNNENMKKSNTLTTVLVIILLIAVTAAIIILLLKQTKKQL